MGEGPGGRYGFLPGVEYAGATNFKCVTTFGLGRSRASAGVTSVAKKPRTYQESVAGGVALARAGMELSNTVKTGIAANAITEL